jgi:SAM-dependent methyltransferase
LQGTRFFPEAVADGRVVATSEVGAAELGPEAGEWALVLEHERIPFVSYPYEWPFSMLRSAAELHLELLQEALGEGHTMSDGYAYNVQWVGSRPVFIDVGSFQPAGAGGPWAGYRQFCQTFLIPLMLQAHRGVSYRPLLRGQVDGIPPAQGARLFSRADWARTGVFRHAVLHDLMERRFAGDPTQQVQAQLRSAGFDQELVKAVASKLLKTVRRLRWEPSGSGWSDYGDTCTYDDAGRAAKRAFVDAAVRAQPRRLVYDLGCNDGTYARLAAEHADHVVAVDGDEVTIERLHRQLRDAGDTKVLPLVVDLADPSPGIGWRNRERSRFEDRGRPDVVLALALVHHLALTNGVPLPGIIDWLASFGAEVVVEFVDRPDPMAKRLLANKPEGTHDAYSHGAFDTAVAERFTVLAREELPGGTRTMYHLQLRD